jgi:hypothetical protein
MFHWPQGCDSKSSRVWRAVPRARMGTHVKQQYHTKTFRWQCEIARWKSSTAHDWLTPNSAAGRHPHYCFIRLVRDASGRKVHKCRSFENTTCGWLWSCHSSVMNCPGAALLRDTASLSKQIKIHRCVSICRELRNIFSCHQTATLFGLGSFSEKIWVPRGSRVNLCSLHEMARMCEFCIKSWVLTHDWQVSESSG